MAYDFETTRIQAGTPRPLYLSAFSTEIEFHISARIKSMQHLRQILEASFLREDMLGVRFCAWNANAFDAYFIAAALLDAPGYLIRPYVTQTGALRGLLILRQADLDDPKAKGWEFLDGMAMTGLAGVSLRRFAETFAPDHAKLAAPLDFARETFDPANPLHRAYADRDSEALYYAINRAQQIMVEHFDQPLSPTMGNACIRIFKRHIPVGKVIRPTNEKTEQIVRDLVLRGGFCFCVGRYQGPVWKYDLNQAYAAAMRDAALPAGQTSHRLGESRYARVYIARVTARHQANRVPVYVKLERAQGAQAVYALDAIPDAWLTSIEVEQLRSEGWTIQVHEMVYWSEQFSMRAFVDSLEALRSSCAGGPSGAIGTMVKSVGNHAYGKTIERIDPKEIIYCAECPPGFMPYAFPQRDNLYGVEEHIWFRPVEKVERDYHKPEIGAFITAHVRMVLRRAMLLDPQAWLYADTDSVAFSRSVTDKLNIDPVKYGAWKIEEDGAAMRIIGKKVYQRLDGKRASAKGMKVKDITEEEWQAWYAGTAPVQRQVHRQSFARVMAGAEMYIEQTRAGGDGARA